MWGMISPSSSWANAISACWAFSWSRLVESLGSEPGSEHFCQAPGKSRSTRLSFRSFRSCAYCGQTPLRWISCNRGVE